jgi:hypothetical protein
LTLYIFTAPKGWENASKPIFGQEKFLADLPWCG